MGGEAATEAQSPSPPGGLGAGRIRRRGGREGLLMPEVSKPPLHTLPHDLLIARLKSLTTLRVVPDPASPTGYATEYEPFQGWESVPTW